MSHLIEIRDMYKIYAIGGEPVHALDGVSLSVDEGEFVAIMGSSGSGKSTMLNILGCLDVPTKGSYLLDGTEVAARTRTHGGNLVLHGLFARAGAGRGGRGAGSDDLSFSGHGF